MDAPRELGEGVGIFWRTGTVPSWEGDPDGLAVEVALWPLFPWSGQVNYSSCKGEKGNLEGERGRGEVWTSTATVPDRSCTGKV